MAKLLLTSGCLIGLFVVYQLWGTGLHEASSQRELSRQFDVQLASLDESPSAEPEGTKDPLDDGGRPDTTAPADLPLPEVGDPVATISIPKIGVTRTVVSGVDRTQLKRGPGHYPETPLPGQAGNAAIAGHRTTYGQPFHNIDRLDIGDSIDVETLQGKFTYEVDDITIVTPRDVEVLAHRGDNRLTLTSCHPKYSQRERIIVSAVLRDPPAPPIAGQDAARTEAAHEAASSADPSQTVTGIDGDTTQGSVGPVITWAVLSLAIWLAVIRCAQFARRRQTGWPVHLLPYPVGLAVVALPLYLLFESTAALLPPNF